MTPDQPPSPNPSTVGGRLRPGDRVGPMRLETLGGGVVQAPAPDGRFTHLQFRRFAGCPVCDLHLRSFVGRLDEIERAGLQEVIFFHSTPEDLAPYVGDLPLTTVADPGKRFYRRFGVEAGVRALLDPRVWGPIGLAIGKSLWRILTRGAPVPTLTPEGGRWGLPADFLIDGQGRIVACHYGEHAYDQWSVDDLLGLVGAGQSANRPAAAPASGNARA